MNFIEPPRGFLRGAHGILVEPDELEIFKNYLEHFRIPNRYADFNATLRRIRKAGKAVIFWHDGYCLHRCGNVVHPSHWMIRVRFNTLYEHTVDASGILELL